MSEMKRIYETLTQWQSLGLQTAMATVVSIRGSAYRRPGARMLIREDGESFGMIGGGCFDANVREIALQVMQTHRPQLHRFVLSDDDVWGLGLGCNGSIYVLIESLTSELGKEWINHVQQLLNTECCLMIQHYFHPSLDYASECTNGDVIMQRRYRLFPSGTVKKDVYLGPANEASFVEWVEPMPRLVIFGAGHDVIPVVEFAYQAGFDVTVIDQRSHLLNHERFSHASTFIHAWPKDYQKVLCPAKQGDFVLFMSHKIENDAEAFRIYYSHPVQYFGFLGPKRRKDSILNEILRLDALSINKISEFIHSPIGLDIGSETAEEVALSIVAELVAVRNRRQSGFLRDKEGPIHGDRPKSSLLESIT